MLAYVRIDIHIFRFYFVNPPAMNKQKKRIKFRAYESYSHLKMVVRDGERKKLDK